MKGEYSTKRYAEIIRNKTGLNFRTTDMNRILTIRVGKFQLSLKYDKTYYYEAYLLLLKTASIQIINKRTR